VATPGPSVCIRLDFDPCGESRRDLNPRPPP